jgi:hypothetical protein
MPISFPLRQTARQGMTDPAAVNVNFFGNRGRRLKLRLAPVAEKLRTVQAIALAPDAIVAGVVTAWRRTIRLSSTKARSAVRGSTMLKTPAHSEHA